MTDDDAAQRNAAWELHKLKNQPSPSVDADPIGAAMFELFHAGGIRMALEGPQVGLMQPDAAGYAPRAAAYNALAALRPRVADLAHALAARIGDELREAGVKVTKAQACDPSGEIRIEVEASGGTKRAICARLADASPEYFAKRMRHRRRKVAAPQPEMA